MKKYLIIFYLLSSCLIPQCSFAQSDELMQGIQQLMQKFQEGAYADVLSISENMLSLAEKEFGQTDPNYAIVLSVVAIAQAEMGHSDRAEKNFNLALTGLKNAPAEYASFTGRVYFGLGKIYLQESKFEKGEDYLQKSLPVFAQTVGRDGPDYANTLNELGNLYKGFGEYAKSEKYLKEAGEIRKKVLGETNPAYGVSLNNLGSLYEQMGDYKNAALLYEQSYNIWHQSLGQYHPLIATAFNNYAGLYLKVGSYAEAEKFYSQALMVCEKVYGIKHERYITTLSNLGNLYCSMRKFGEAEKCALTSLNLRKETVGSSHIDYAYSLNNLGIIKMNLRNFSEAEKLLTEAITIFRKELGKNHKNVATCANNLSAVYIQNNEPLKAAKYMRESLSIALGRIDNVFPSLNDKEKTMFYGTIQYDFEFFNYFISQNFTANPSLAADMYNYTIATKALLLNASNKVRKRILNSGDAELIKLYEDWKSKKNRMAQVWQMSMSDKASQQIDEAALENEVSELEKKLSGMSELFASNNEKRQSTWKDIQRKLRADEAAVEIVRFRKFNFEFTDTVHYAALVIKTNSSYPEIIFLENGNFIETKLLTLYKNSIKLKLKDEKSYDGFWAPIAAHLNGIRKVFLSPDGVYNQINLNSLYNTSIQKHVLDEIEIQQVTNTKDILALPKKSSLRNAIMLGFPDYKTLPDPDKSTDVIPGENEKVSDSIKREMENSVTSLPGTLTEVNLIANIFKLQNIMTQIVTGTSANEAFLKKVQSPSVLHIATHGYFLNNIETNTQNVRGLLGADPIKAIDNPLLRSGILLAGAQKTISGFRSNSEDGILSAYEAMNLNLDQTQLVVLSACETGLGEVHNGEGVYGFQRALIIAGAQAVVMSLWKVNDQVTQELMTEFYKFWMEGNEKRKAFMMAQNKIRASHAEPYFWAPFILIGD